MTVFNDVPRKVQIFVALRDLFQLFLLPKFTLVKSFITVNRRFFVINFIPIKPLVLEIPFLSLIVISLSK